MSPAPKRTGSPPPRDEGSPNRTRLRAGREHITALARDGIDARDWIELCQATDRTLTGERVVIADVRAVVKSGSLAPSGGRRHALRSALLRTPAPAEREFLHLRWLRERLFHAPEPLVAITVWRRLRPVRQLFATHDLGALPGMEDAFRSGSPVDRGRWSRELGVELGRLHALRFLHADLYPRNILVAGPGHAGLSGAGRELVWIDAWAGGPTAWRRGSLARLERDLGTLFSIATEFMTEEEQRLVLDAYLASREANGRPVRELSRFLGRVRAERARELQRLRDRPKRLRGRPFPSRPFAYDQ